MTRTQSAKTLADLLVTVVVLVGLSGLLAHTVQKARAAAGQMPSPPPVQAR